ncbi:MAG: putative zinc-binding metallopeptidase [Mariprofundales bacterium]
MSSSSAFKKRVFYTNPDKKISDAHIPLIYRNWHKTDFVSLYAAMNIYEDFAETFAMYVHVVMQGHPWQLTLVQSGKIVSTFDKPILHERCKTKKAYMASIFSK